MSKPVYRGRKGGLTRDQYDQTREFSDAIQEDLKPLKSIDRHAGHLIELQSENNELTRQTNDLLDQGNEHLVAIRSEIIGTKQEIADGFDRTVDMLGQGFSATIFQLCQANHSLDTLLKKAETPAETWAMEQYSQAHKAYQRQLFPEALEALHRAIDGHGSNVGWRTQHRFHLLKGIIQLGDPEPADLRDYGAAEASFSAAARYSLHDEPAEAANAWLGAGRAAYNQGEYVRAENHFQASLALRRTGDAAYHLAKTLACQQKYDDALAALETAIRAKADYLVEMHRDEDFAALGSQLDRLEACLLEYGRSLALAIHGQIRQRVAALAEARFGTSSWTWDLPEACPEEFEAFRSLADALPDPADAALPQVNSFLRRVASEGRSRYERVIEAWQGMRLRALAEAREDTQRRRRDEVADVKGELLKSGGLLEGFGGALGLTVFAVLHPSLRPASPILILVAIVGGIAWSYFMGRRAREQIGERLEMVEADFDRQEAELAAASAQADTEMNEPFEPPPETYLVQWRDGTPRCSGTSARLSSAKARPSGAA
jgi:tetratricopeptide (TPR) repeat protein